MTPTLTDEQARAAASGPVRLVDPATNRSYVLLSEELYDRVKELLADDPRDAYPAIDRAFAEGWDDPKMDDYDRYEDLKR